MHFIGPDQMHGFEERVTTDIYPSDYAWTPDWDRTEERIDKWYHNMATVKEAGIGAATFQIDYDEEVAFFAKLESSIMRVMTTSLSVLSPASSIRTIPMSRGRNGGISTIRTRSTCPEPRCRQRIMTGFRGACLTGSRRPACH